MWEVRDNRAWSGERPVLPEWLGTCQIRPMLHDAFIKTISHFWTRPQDLRTRYEWDFQRKLEGPDRLCPKADIKRRRRGGRLRAGAFALWRFSQRRSFSGRLWSARMIATAPFGGRNTQLGSKCRGRLPIGSQSISEPVCIYTLAACLFFK